MRYLKCPRCELNYIKEGEEYCDVCIRELKGERLDADYCYICGKLLKDGEEDICSDCRNDAE